MKEPIGYTIQIRARKDCPWFWQNIAIWEDGTINKDFQDYDWNGELEAEITRRKSWEKFKRKNFDLAKYKYAKIVKTYEYDEDEE